MTVLVIFMTVVLFCKVMNYLAALPTTCFPPVRVSRDQTVAASVTRQLLEAAEARPD